MKYSRPNSLEAEARFALGVSTQEKTGTRVMWVILALPLGFLVIKELNKKIKDPNK